MEVTIQPINRVVSVQPGANLLEVLRANQIPVSYSCCAGRCGTCRCKILEGAVLDAGRDAPYPTHEADRHVLACQTFLTEPCIIEIPEPDEIVVHPARIIKASVLAIDELTHDIRRVRLKPSKPLEFSPGQYAQLQFTPEHIRPYSMAGLSDDDTLEFHVRLVPDGRVTAYIAQQLKPGDAVRVSGPMGSAYLRRKHEGPILCVAGGTGLAPILSILRGTLHAGLKNPVHLYLGVRSARDIYGLQEIDALRDAGMDLRTHVVVTAGDGDAGHRAGLVTDSIAQDFNDLRDWRAYLCGSPPMVEAATRLVQRMGLPPERVYADAFYASPI